MPPRPLPRFEAQFPGFAPRAAQRAVDSLPLPDERGSVVLLESETGSGKTEAALRWASRLIDAGLVDGCFFADGEIAGRSMKEIPHPFIAESVERFRTLAPAERAKVFFTHLNHTNPAADPASEATRAVNAAGMHVLDEGHLFGL